MISLLALLVAVLTLPPSIDQSIASAARDHGVDPHVLRAMLTVESGLDPAADAPGGRGIAQLTPSGIRGLRWIRGPGGAPFAEADAMNPALAIPAAAELLAWWAARFGSIEAGCAGYHRGGAAARAVRAGGSHYYVTRVMAVAQRLRSQKTDAGILEEALKAVDRMMEPSEL